MGHIAQGMSLYATYAVDALKEAQESPELATRLVALDRAIANAGACLRAEVEDMRHNGATWQQIGDALGVTRQAAQQRFRRYM